MSDIVVIKEIEECLTTKLGRLDSIWWNSIGYTIDEKCNVTGIGLYNLNLSDLNICIEFLVKLRNLRVLNVSGNYVQQIEPLSKLPNLTELYLYNNSIVDYIPLRDLQHLRKLGLSDIRQADLEILQELSYVNEIGISGDLSDKISELSIIENLTELYIRYVSDSCLTAIEELKNLRKLGLNEFKLTDKTPLSSLRKVTHLYLDNNQLANIKRLQELGHLEFLHLAANEIIDIEPLSELTKLEELHLSSNLIEDISPIRGFKKLKILNLNNNKIHDITPLSELVGLEELDLGVNQISNISPLGGLKNLKNLDMTNNQIIDISVVSNFETLKELHISGNQIVDILPVGKLMELVKLNLFSNQVIDLSPVKNLHLLRELIISFNQVNNISSLTDLKNLLILDLNYNQIIDIRDLCNLNQLQEVNLSGNQVIDISPLENMNNLVKLDLKGNQINNILPLVNLQKLEYLELAFNQLSEISVVGKLKNLKELDLAYNKITDITPLRTLEKIRQLNVGHNEIEDITILKELFKLTSLNLEGNQLGDIDILGQLRNLHELKIGYNKLKDISAIGNLENLLDLNIEQNELENIAPLEKLVKLNRLNISRNWVKDLAPLKRMNRLTNLDISNNHITDLVSIKELKTLNTLYLQGNPIEELPKWIVDFNMDISWMDYGFETGNIFLYNNPFPDTLINVIKLGKEALINYFNQFDVWGKDYIYEAKIMIVGEPGSGKSTLLNILFDKTFLVPNVIQKSTLGIDVRKNWNFKTSEDKDFNANIWDFGGQQIQFMLHQFFLTPDSLYILMSEKRKELANFDYWLNIINILGKNSPVIVLFNEINIEIASSFIYDEKKYSELFPNLSLQDLEINLSNLGDGRFDVLLDTIRKKLVNLEHVGKEVPAPWVDIRKELENLTYKRYINIDEYLEICKKYKIFAEKDALLILNTFHKLGLVLHFSEDPHLNGIIFLDHNWAVDAVYAVLSDESVKKSNGLFTQTKIEELWSQKAYNVKERAKLLQLMLRDNFELCFKIPGGKEEYLVPLLLSNVKPNYEWNYESNMKYRFLYPFMPKGIVSRIIVRLHEFIDSSLQWNEGVVLKKNNSRAQILETKNSEGSRIIDIRITGNPNYRKELLILIREEIRKIKEISFPNLPYFEMVPCNCTECQINIEPEFYRYEALENLLFKKNIKEKQCQQSGEMVYITDMIDAIYKELEEKEVKRKSKVRKNQTQNDNPKITNNFFNNNMKIDKVDVHGGQAVFADNIGNINYQYQNSYTREQFEDLKGALLMLKESELRTLKQVVKENENLKTTEENGTLGKKLKEKLLGFGVSVVEKMSEMGIQAAVSYIFANINF